MGLLRRGSSDVEALDRSFRSRILLLGLLCVGAIGLATWSGTRETGRQPRLHVDRERIAMLALGERDGLDQIVLQRREEQEN